MSHIDILTEEFRYHLSHGHCRKLASRKAFAYARRYTDREVTTLPSVRADAVVDCFDEDSSLFFRFNPDSFLISEGSWNDAMISPEQRACFNSLFKRLFDFAKNYYDSYGDDVGLKYIARLARVLNLEQLLDENFQDEVMHQLQLAGLEELSTQAGFSAFCGYGARPIEGKVPKPSHKFMTRMRNFETRLRNFAKNLI